VSESQFNLVLNIELDLYNDREMQISIFVRYAGMIGTTRPIHYNELFDEVGFSADDPQELVHSLSYAYQTRHNNNLCIWY